MARNGLRKEAVHMLAVDPAAGGAREGQSVRAAGTAGIREAALAPPRAGRPGGPRWLCQALTWAGIALAPWLIVLVITLPASTRVTHWPAAWAGLDALESLGLAGTGWLLRRGDPRHCLTATATAAFLVADAWMDMTTATPGASLATAIVMAVCAELPAAGLCAVLAIRSLRRPA
jgi:hypothetical protein